MLIDLPADTDFIIRIDFDSIKEDYVSYKKLVSDIGEDNIYNLYVKETSRDNNGTLVITTTLEESVITESLDEIVDSDKITHKFVHFPLKDLIFNDLSHNAKVTKEIKDMLKDVREEKISDEDPITLFNNMMDYLQNEVDKALKAKRDSGLFRYAYRYYSKYLDQVVYVVKDRVGRDTDEYGKSYTYRELFDFTGFVSDKAEKIVTDKVNTLFRRFAKEGGYYFRVSGCKPWVTSEAPNRETISPLIYGKFPTCKK